MQVRPAHSRSYSAAPRIGLACIRCPVYTYTRPVYAPACIRAMITSGTRAPPLSGLSRMRHNSRSITAEALDLEGVKPLPQIDLLPMTQSQFFRTVWTDDAQVGKGFQRTGSVFKPTAIAFTPAEVGTPVTSQSQSFRIINSAEDFAASILVGGSAAVEGWGASVSASFEVSSSAAFSEDSITASLRRSYISRPLVYVRPSVHAVTDYKELFVNSLARLADAKLLADHAEDGKGAAANTNREAADVAVLGGDVVSPTVLLLPEAYNLLKTRGPIAFENTYGSHFVSGYTVGGVYNGTYRMKYTSISAANAASAGVRASFNKFGVGGAADSKFEAEVQESESLTEIDAGFQATGWNSTVSPQVVSNLETLIESANQIEVDDGERLEAVLGKYTDIEDYRIALAEFQEANESSDDVSTISEEKFNIIAQTLSQEFLAFDFYERLLHEALSLNSTPEYKTEAQKLMQAAVRQKALIREKFGAGEAAQENWVRMAAYIQFVEEERVTGCDVVATGEDAEAGRVLANEVICSKDLGVLYDDFNSRQEAQHDISASVVYLQGPSARDEPLQSFAFDIRTPTKDPTQEPPIIGSGMFEEYQNELVNEFFLRSPGADSFTTRVSQRPIAVQARFVFFPPTNARNRSKAATFTKTFPLNKEDIFSIRNKTEEIPVFDGAYKLRLEYDIKPFMQLKSTKVLTETRTLESTPKSVLELQAEVLEKQAEESHENMRKSRQYSTSWF